MNNMQDYINQDIKDRLEKECFKALDIKPEIDPPITAMSSISVKEIQELINNWNKMPTYDELMKANNRMNRVLTKYVRRLNYLWEHTTQQNNYYSALQELDKILLEEQEVLKNVKD